MQPIRSIFGGGQDTGDDLLRRQLWQRGLRGGALGEEEQGVSRRESQQEEGEWGEGEGGQDGSDRGSEDGAVGDDALVVEGGRSSRSGGMEGQICRYCLDGDPLDGLIFPCSCTTPVHTDCLGSWLRSSGRAPGTGLRCELCSAELSATVKHARWTSIAVTKEGRSILIKFLLRLVYRALLMRRLWQQYTQVIQDWGELLRRRSKKKW